MKKQIFVINGGTSAFEKYEDFLAQLRTKPIYIDKFKGFRDWKSGLPEMLGEEYEVILLNMPNKESARYAEWKIWFERFFEFLQDDVILIGHSLGGIFLAKYLSEETFPKKIRATLLVAAPFEWGGSGEGRRTMGEFSLTASLQNLEKQGGGIYLFHSKDDPVVQFEELEKYQKALPQAHVQAFEDRKHFNTEQFPELVQTVQSL